VGIQQRLVTGLTIPDLNRLVLLVQPAHLAKLARKELTPDEEAVERALWLRRSLKDVDCD
jgi:protein-arginine kinase